MRLALKSGAQPAEGYGVLLGRGAWADQVPVACIDARGLGDRLFAKPVSSRLTRESILLHVGMSSRFWGRCSCRTCMGAFAQGEMAGLLSPWHLLESSSGRGLLCKSCCLVPRAGRRSLLSQPGPPKNMCTFLPMGSRSPSQLPRLERALSRPLWHKLCSMTWRGHLRNLLCHRSPTF